MATPLPKRRIILIESGKNKSYRLNDFVGKDDEYIKNNIGFSILVDYYTLVNNFDLLKHILKIKDIDKINCLDYESAVYLEQNLDLSIDIALVDDYKNKDRSYIDTSVFEKNKFYIPLSYSMWIPEPGDSFNVFCSLVANNMTMTNHNNSNKEINKEVLIKIRELIEKLNLKNLSDVDRCLILSNYFQSNVQYVDDIESVADRVYIIDSKGELLKGTGLVDTVINENYGVCEGIANATTLLLNNPIVNMNVRTVYGIGHTWNLVTIDGKKYFMDNTWCITRNPSRVENALKASDFTDKYLLFGSDTASLIGHHDTYSYVDGILEKEDYDRNDLSKKEKQLVLGNYGNSLRFESKVKE